MWLHSFLQTQKSEFEIIDKLQNQSDKQNET